MRKYEECWQCKGTDFKVNRTYPLNEDGVLRRKCTCKTCGKSYLMAQDYWGFNSIVRETKHREAAPKKVQLNLKQKDSNMTVINLPEGYKGDITIMMQQLRNIMEG